MLRGPHSRHLRFQKAKCLTRFRRHLGARETPKRDILMQNKRPPAIPAAAFFSYRTVSLHNRLKQSVQPIERGDSVRFGHRRIVERGRGEIPERIRFTFLLHDRLTDVNDFGSVGAKAMNAQQF